MLALTISLAGLESFHISINGKYKACFRCGDLLPNVSLIGALNESIKVTSSPLALLPNNKYKIFDIFLEDIS